MTHEEIRDQIIKRITDELRLRLDGVGSRFVTDVYVHANSSRTETVINYHKEDGGKYTVRFSGR